MKINKNTMYGQCGSVPKPNRSERRKNKINMNELDYITKEIVIQEEVEKRVLYFTDHFFNAMRQNNISVNRCQKILDDTAKLILKGVEDNE